VGVAPPPRLVGPGTRAVLEDPSLGRYFIAEADGLPVGQLMLTFEWSDWRNGVFWWIQSVHVEPDHRGRGVFGALFRHVAELARASEGVCGLRLYVDRDNQRAQVVYAHLGLHLTHYDVMETVFRGPASHRET
jgi:GNAT superfamily N-acetyltransferase